jgi:two-component system, OmpR family, sensor histidine kinase VicK
MQKEFINVAAHELRTPIQPILGLSEVISSKIRNTEQDTTEVTELLDVIARNARRLQRLTEDILDITKIESQSLRLSKQNFNVNDIIESIIADYKKEGDNNNKRKIKLVYPPNHDNENDIFVEGDKERLTQVISNLLSSQVHSGRRDIY